MSLIVKQQYTCDECGEVAVVESWQDTMIPVLKVKPPPFDWWTSNLAHYCEKCAKKMLQVRPEAIA